MPGRPPVGRPVVPRRLTYCMDCESQTVQWLRYVKTASPGSYRGTRLFNYYVCTDCGRVQL